MKVLSAAAALLAARVAYAQDVVCPDEYDDTVSPQEGTSFSYSIVGDYLCGHMETDGEKWVGFGISPEGTMAGGQGIVGIPGAETEVAKYDMVFGAVTPMAAEKQTLAATSLSQADGKTVMKFAKLLSEEGENPIDPAGENTFLWAIGMSNTPGYHAARSPFTLNLGGEAAVPATLPAEPVPATLPAEPVPATLPAEPVPATLPEESVELCVFCPDGLTVPPETMRPDGFSCGQTVDFAAALPETDEWCPAVVAAQDVCCPAAPEAPDTCSFCPDGIPDETVLLPTQDGATCATAAGYAASLASDDANCPTVQQAEMVCCPAAPAEAAPALCVFCPDGLTVPPETLRPDGFSCGQTVDFAVALPETDEWCPAVVSAQDVCCPAAPPAATEAPPAVDVTEAPPTEPAMLGTSKSGKSKSSKMSKSTKGSKSKSMKTPKDPMAKTEKATKSEKMTSEKSSSPDAKAEKAPLVDVDAKAEKAKSGKSKSAKAKSVKSEKSSSTKAHKGDAPVSEAAPAEEAPVEEAPVEEAPVEEAPAEEPVLSMSMATRRLRAVY